MKPKRQSIIALDQWFNATFFKGWADETLSARAYRNSAQGVQKWVRVERWINKLFFWQKNHCKDAYQNEQARMHMPPSYRDSANRT